MLKQKRRELAPHIVLMTPGVSALTHEALAVFEELTTSLQERLHRLKAGLRDLLDRADDSTETAVEPGRRIPERRRTSSPPGTERPRGH
jgi:hypothetical protein